MSLGGVNEDELAWAIPLLIQEGWRAQRRGGCPVKSERQVEIITTPAPGATPPQLRRGVSSITATFIFLVGIFMSVPTDGEGVTPSQPGHGNLPGADLVLLHGKVWTGEPASPPGTKPGVPKFAEALAITNGRFLAVGSSAEIQPHVGRNTKVVDLKGRLAVPGLIDSHAHFIVGGFQLLSVNLKDARSEEEFTRRIAEKAKTLAPGRWISGGEWDEQAWAFARLPTRQMIDAVTEKNPVCLSRYDGHAVLANLLALKLAAVTRATPDPVGGIIVRDAAGEPTGVFKDAAQDLITRAIPRPTQAEMTEALHAALAEAARVGVTTIHSITVDTDSWNGSFTGEIQLLRRAEAEGWLTCRMYEIVPIARWEELRDTGIEHNTGDEFIKWGAVKAFADGSLGSATARMYEPFADDPSNRGIPLPLMNPPAKMEALARGADQAHIQICIHAIGDRAIAEILNMYEGLGRENAPAHRFRIEHAQHLRPQDFARFSRLGIIASMQPYHAIDDGRWAEKRLGHERAKSSYAWRSMLDAGATLAFGSDWPVAPLSPLLGIYAAVTRATLDGKNPQGWFPEQRLTVEEALRAYTQGSAYAAFQEKVKGTIEPGKLGDVVVLSNDLFAIPPETIKDAHVIMTIVGGRIVYKGN
jgi:predicted amidohydrolase YtcJ